MSIPAYQSDFFSEDGEIYLEDFSSSHLAIDKPFIQKIISDIALSSLKELTVSLAITGVTCLFVASPAIPTLLITTISLVALNTLIRSLTGTLIYQRHKIDGEQEPDLATSLDTQIQLCQFLCPTTFTLLDETTRGVLVHEAGHAAAVALVYQKAHPIIEIMPFEGGVTRFGTGPLTRVGQFLGAYKSRLLITAAGPAVAVLTATAHIGLSHYFQDSHPELSRYLLITGISNIVQHIFYALSALWQTSPSPGHDFVFLWKVGHIHPCAAVVTMVAIPLFVKGLLFAIEHNQNRQTARVELDLQPCLP